MLSFLIDPQLKKVFPHFHPEDDDNWKAIAPAMDCHTFSCVYPADFPDTLYVDDEGLIHNGPKHFYQFDGVPQPLVGKSLVLGCDDQGETINAQSTLEDVTRRVRFITYARSSGPCQRNMTVNPYRRALALLGLDRHDAAALHGRTVETVKKYMSGPSPRSRFLLGTIVRIV